MMTNDDTSTKKMILVMRSTYFILWGSKFIGQQYMSMFLREFPFTNDLIVGIMMSMGFLVTTLSQLVWGRVADHAPTKNRVLAIVLAGVSAGFVLLVLPIHTSLPILSATCFVYYMFSAIPGMLVDTIVVENTNKRGIHFGLVKSFASAGAGAFALIMFLISLVMALRPATTFVLALVSAVAAFFPISFLPATKGHAYGVKAEKGKAPFKEILKNSRLVLLLCFLLLFSIALQATNVFMGIYYSTDAGFNAGLGMYGLFYAICIAIETCLMLFGDRYWHKVRIYHIFTLACLAACTRSLIFYLAPNIYVIQLSGISHALIFAPLWSRLSPYVNDIVSMELRATGQAAWYIMVFGLGPMIGAAMAGVIVSNLGIRNLFLSTGAMLFVIGVVFYFLFRRQYKQYEDGT